MYVRLSAEDDNVISVLHFSALTNINQQNENMPDMTRTLVICDTINFEVIITHS